LAGYSLGGQLALWGIYKAQSVQDWGPQLAIHSEEIAGGVAICPSLESERSLRYLMAHPIGRLLEQRITQNLKQLAHQLYQYHPQAFDPAAIERANSIWGFDQELVIGRLGFVSVQDYYQSSSALPLLAQLHKPTWILYAADDPLFDPTLIPELQAIAQGNPALDLALTQYGGHVGYFSSQQCQAEWGDPDPWWAIHRTLHWLQAGPSAVLASRPNLGLVPSPG
jgi:predicted alpha/beta-fold hydrolase